MSELTHKEYFDINNPFNDFNLSNFNFPLDDDSGYLYIGESDITNLNSKCVNHNIPIKISDHKRITLFNVHNFVSVCNQVKGRGYQKFSKYFNQTNSDILFLTELVPDYQEINTLYKKEIKDKKLNDLDQKKKIKDRLIRSTNFYNFIKSLNLRKYFLGKTITITHFLANGIFSNVNSDNRRIHYIGSGRIILECKVNLFDKNIILLLTHFQHISNGYQENVNKTLKIIRNLKEHNRYIIFGGDFNKSILDPELDLIKKELVYLQPLTNEITGFHKNKQIDLFFVSQDFSNDFNTSIIINKSYLSDHYPVILDFILN